MPAFPSTLTGPPVVSPGVGLPDLVITSLTAQPDAATLTGGESVWFTATVQNAGIAATPVGVPIQVSFAVDGGPSLIAQIAGPLQPLSTAFVAYTAATGVSYDGGVGSYTSTPDTAANSITGDIDLRALIAPTTWSPSSAMTIVGKEASGSTRSYWFNVATTGHLGLTTSNDGTANVATTSAAHGFAADGTARWVRVTRDVNDGAGNHVDAFYTSTDYNPAVLNSGTWTAIGSPITTAGTTTIFDSTSLVEVGSLFGGTVNRYTGNIYRVQIISGIGGTLKADYNPADAAKGASSWASSTTGETWTDHGNATLLGVWTALGGTHTVRATVDPSNLIPESAGSNTFDLGLTVSTSLPDLIVQSISTSPATPAIGDQVTFSAVVKNQGAGPTPAATVIGVSFAVDGTLVQFENNDNSPMLVGETRTMTANVGLASISDLSLTGTATPVLSTPDSAALSITGDIDIRAKVALSDWTPAAATYFVEKWRTSGNQRSYAFSIDTTGHLKLEWSTNGTAVTTATASAATGIADGTTSWVRAVLKVASPYRAKFYKSTDGITWTQIGTNIDGGGATSIFDGTAPLEIGALDGTGNLTGQVFRVQVFNGIGGPNAPTRVQSAVNKTGASSASFSPGTLGVSPTAGNVLVVYIASLNTITAPAGGWTKQITNDVNTDTSIFTKEVVAGDATSYTFTIASSTQSSGRIEEWSGVREVIDSATATSNTTVSSVLTLAVSPGATAQANDLVVAALGTAGATAQGSPSFNQGLSVDTSDAQSTTATKVDLTTATEIMSATHNFTTTSASWSNAQGATLVFAVLKGFNSVPVADIDMTKLNATTPLPYTDPNGNIWTANATPTFDTTTAPVWTATAGTHSIIAGVDYLALIPESDETNNTLATSLVVAGAAGFADLIVTNVSMSPPNPGVGTAVTFSATITNQGDTATPGGIVHGVSFSLDGGGVVASSTTNTSSLASGASRTQAADGAASAVIDVNFSGLAADYVDTPDSAALSITGDTDIRVKVALADWTPAVDNTLISKWNDSGVNQRSWKVVVNGAGKIVWYWSTDGTQTFTLTSSAATGVADGSVKWVRVTFSVSNPLTATFYLSDDGTTWAQLGTPQTFASTSFVFDSTAPVSLMGFDAAGSSVGKFYRAQVYNGIAGTIKADLDATLLNVSTPFPYTDPNGNVWSKHGAITTDNSSGAGTWAATAGAHTIVARVDPNNLLVESDENNNTLSFAFTVGTITRSATIQPFAATSPWNVSLGDAITTSVSILASAGHIDSLSFGVAVANAGYDYVAPTDTQLMVSIVRNDGLTADEYVQFNVAGQVQTATDLTGTGINTTAAIRPTKFSPLAGIIRSQEITAGVIPHALALAGDSTILSTAFVWPAFGQEGNAAANTGAVPSGSLLAIPWATVMPGGMSTAGQIIFTALKTYGGYIVQRSGSGLDILAETAADTLVNPARADLPTILPLLRIVTNNSADAGATNVGGPGNRRGPVAASAVVAGPTGGVLPVTGGGTGGGTRDAKLWPFPSTDPFNMPRGDGCTFDPNNRMVAGFAHTAINTVAFGTTINGSGETTTQQLDTAENHHCDIQADGRTVWGFNSFMGASLHTTVDIKTGNSYNCFVIGNPGAYERATKMSGMAGPIRKWELQNAVNGDVHAIKHCIGLGISGKVLNSTFVWPAFATDSFAGSNTGFMPAGGFMAIPSTATMPTGLNLAQQALWWALHDYGAYEVDATGGNGGPDPSLTILEGEAGADSLITTWYRNSAASSDANAGTIAVLQQLRWVTNASQSNVGGPGNRLAQLAPAIA